MSKLRPLFLSAEQATRASPAAVQRLAERIASLAPSTSVHWRRASLVGAAGLACAGAGVVIFLERSPARSTPLEVALAASTPTSFEPVPEVSATLTGTGELAGTQDAPLLRLTAGTLDLEVTPGRGIALTVQTDEATASVHGTSFRVVRDALGTFVSVRDGLVATTCTGAPTRDLGAGQTLLCLPVRAAGLLGRARALRDAARYDDAIQALDLVLGQTQPGDATRGEALALEAQVLLLLFRPSEAVHAARAYRAEGYSVRTQEMTAIEAAGTDPASEP
jgi:ferric-dicitrate binding protein FerR (iron transport regulator)